MATRMLRRGLPRVPGGEPWPPADAVVEAASEVADGATYARAGDAASAATATVPGADTPDVGPISAASPTSGVSAAEAGVPGTAAAPAPTDAQPAASAPGAAPASESDSRVTPLRRGLPRTPGGEPWPPASLVASTPGDAPVAEAVASAAAEATVPAAGATSPAASGAQGDSATSTSTSTATAAAAATAATVAATAGTEATSGAGSASAGVRRGIPRVVGGDPWPPAGTVPAAAVPTTSTAETVPVAETVASAPAETTGFATGADAGAPAAPASAGTPARARATDIGTPLPWKRTVWNGAAPRHITATAPASARPRLTWTQAIAGLLGAAALGILAGAAVAFVRTLLSFPFMQDFLVAFPGEYEPAIHVEPGFAPWIGWQHFFNMFLMLLIIRSGLRIRGEKRPTAFWTPRNNPKGKVSLTIWFHQSLDLLWLINGALFIVLLFATGHWARIVPTSWEVLPNALSAALQYVSFDWPTEHGWVNYNSLQQLAYFTTVFVAAPLAAVTGFRMSGMWPKKAERLSKAYPIEWARAVHFPVMLYFVLFIIAHVALVFLTGFLRNLNHMFASSDAVTWTGFWVFVAAVVVIAGGWTAARPLVLAPIAKLFGSVSGR